MEERLYDMIFKRKSFHLFRNCGQEEIIEEDVELIRKQYQELVPLYPEIKTAIRIVRTEETTCKRGQEYCILFYSEKKDGYLANIGYLGEQLDLWLVSRDIGTLWFGIGKVEEASFEGLDFVIMMAILSGALLLAGALRRIIPFLRKSLLPGAVSLAPIVVDFTLLHMQPNFLRCPPPGTSLFRLYFTSKHVEYPSITLE